jgi:hypothetical protein
LALIDPHRTQPYIPFFTPHFTKSQFGQKDKSEHHADLHHKPKDGRRYLRPMCRQREKILNRHPSVNSDLKALSKAVSCRFVKNAREIGHRAAKRTSRSKGLIASSTNAVAILRDCN